MSNNKYVTSSPKCYSLKLNEMIVIKDKLIVNRHSILDDYTNKLKKYTKNDRESYMIKLYHLANSMILGKDGVNKTLENGISLDMKNYLILLKLFIDDRVDELNDMFGINIGEEDYYHNLKVMELDSLKNIKKIVQAYKVHYINFTSANLDINNEVSGFLVSSTEIINNIKYIREDNSYLFMMPMKISTELNVKHYIFRLDKETAEVFMDMIENRTYPEIMSLYLVGKLLYEDTGKKMYQTFKIKEPGKIREINAPDQDLKVVSQYANNLISQRFEGKIFKLDSKRNTKISLDNTIMGYRIGKSVVDNAKVHSSLNKITDDKKIIKIDIAHFFDSCMYEYFEKTIHAMYSPKNDMNYKDRLSIMHNYSVYNNFKRVIKKILINPSTKGLYMGNPVSGVLANSVMLPVVRYMANTLADRGIKMTIYADDMTFSRYRKNEEEDKYFNIKYIEYIFNETVKKLDLTELTLKEKKSLVQSGTRRKVTGVKITMEDKTTWDRSLYMKLRNILYICDKYKNKTLKDFNEDTSELRGRINFYILADGKGKMLKLLNKYEETANRLGIYRGIIFDDLFN